MSPARKEKCRSRLHTKSRFYHLPPLVLSFLTGAYQLLQNTLHINIPTFTSLISRDSFPLLFSTVHVYGPKPSVPCGVTWSIPFSSEVATKPDELVQVYRGAGLPSATHDKFVVVPAHAGTS